MDDLHTSAEGEGTEGLFLQLAGLLSGQQPAVMEEFSLCIRDTKAYYRERMGQDGLPKGNRTEPGETELNETELDETELDEMELDDADCACVRWLAMAECLVKRNIAAELDWKCELDDFAYCVKELASKKKYKLIFRKAWFDEEDSIEEWGRLLNIKWKESSPCLTEGACLVQLDINSDSYVILPIPNEFLKQAEELAKAVWQNLYPVGTKEKAGTSAALIAFSKKHPWNIRPAEENLLPDSCEKCFTLEDFSGKASFCYAKAGEVFLVLIKSKTLSPGQIVSISKFFRLGAMEIRKRLLSGKEIYVKMKLYDMLMLMKVLQEQQIAYEVSPKAPDFPHFYDCPKKFLFSTGNDWSYHQFDEERKKEWAAEKAKFK